MPTDPDTCEHVWKLDTPPTREAQVVRLKCIKCGVIQDYTQPAEPCPTQTNKPG